MTHDDIIRMAREAGIGETSARFMANLWEIGFEAGAASEREACAKVCEQSDEDGEGPDCWGWHAKDFARAIRARGNT